MPSVRQNYRNDNDDRKVRPVFSFSLFFSLSIFAAYAYTCGERIYSHTKQAVTLSSSTPRPAVSSVADGRIPVTNPLSGREESLSPRKIAPSLDRISHSRNEIARLSFVLRFLRVCKPYARRLPETEARSRAIRTEYSANLDNETRRSYLSRCVVRDALTLPTYAHGLGRISRKMQAFRLATVISAPV